MRVILPLALTRMFAAAEREADIEASTVRELVDALDARWPGMRDRLCDSTPRVRRHINVFVDGERTVLDTAIPPDAEVFVMTAISGG